MDSGEKIKCTPNHRFLLRNGKYKEAKDLGFNDSIMAGYFNFKQIKDGEHYSSLLQPLTGKYEFVHKLADEYNQRLKNARTDVKYFVLHHKNFKRLNNNPDNIQRLTFSEHSKIHIDIAKEVWKKYGDNFREKHRNSLIKAYSSPEARKKLSEKSKKLWKSSKYRAKYPENHFSEMAKKLWRNPEMSEFHRQKTIKQWQDPDFRKKAIEFSRQLKNN